MANEAVSKWRLRGRVFLWRYTNVSSKRSGWNITADAAGAASLVELLSLVRESDYAAVASLPTEHPPADVLDIPNFRREGVGVAAADQLTIRFLRDGDDSRAWQIDRAELSVTLTVGSSLRSDLSRGFHDIAEGRGDWGIGDGDSALMFWWPPRGWS